MNKILLWLILPLLLANCKKEEEKPAPAACMSADNLVVQNNAIITFTNCSQNAASYEWDFGDGTSSSIGILLKGTPWTELIQCA